MAKVVKKITKPTVKKKVATVKKVVKKSPLKRPRGSVQPKKVVLDGLSNTIKKYPSLVGRAANNPIIEPRPYAWESKATLNPAAFRANGKIHLVYRAIGDDDSSVLGYAGTFDGHTIVDRPTHYIYRRYNSATKTDMSVLPIDYISGGGWNGGCEDPRLTQIGETVYMLYTAFDGWGSVRIALTSLSLTDFEKKNWNWKKPVLISPPGEIHKNWVIFPEKINGKYAILTSISPKVMVEYVASLEEFNGKKFIQSYYSSTPEWENSWDTSIRGVGPTPIKTELGWLLLYHAMDETDPNRYKLGALILDLNDPTKILYHSNAPILEPDESYENFGYKWGVVYSCGAVEKYGELLIYYGGADKVVAVATLPLKELLKEMQKGGKAKLKKTLTKLP